MGLIHDLVNSGITAAEIIAAVRGGGAGANTNAVVTLQQTLAKTGALYAMRPVMVRVKVTSNAAGGGKYNGRILLSATNAVSATGDLAETDIGVSDTQDALILNPNEIGRTTHCLTSAGSAVYLGYLQPDRSTEGKQVVVLTGEGRTGDIFRVNLSQTGGTAGTQTTGCSFTYTVSTLSSVQLGTSKGPQYPRGENGLKVAATQGLAYFDTSGVVQLAVAFEGSGTATC